MRLERGLRGGYLVRVIVLVLRRYVRRALMRRARIMRVRVRRRAMVGGDGLDLIS